MRTKYLITTAAAILWAVALLAVPARRERKTVTQSDGTKLEIAMVGDEFGHLTVTNDGVAVVFDSTNGNYCFAQRTAEGLVSSGVEAHRSQRLTASQRSRLVTVTDIGTMAVEQRARSQARRAEALESEPANYVNRVAAHKYGGTVTGDYRSIVILVDFPDQPFSMSDAHSVFNEFLNGDAYNYQSASGSVHEYFGCSSTGQLNLQFDLYGPYTLEHNLAYYGANDLNGNDKRAGEMIVEACAAADAQADFSLYANNGTVRNVYVVYAGFSEAESYGTNSNLIWPHQSWVSTSDGQITYDGVRVSAYACSSELQYNTGTTLSGVGTFCHEFSHILGLLDFYDTDYDTNGQAFGLSITSLMDYGCYLNEGRTPPVYNSMERWLLGWSVPETLTEVGSYRLEPIYQNHSYKLDSPTSDEFFLFENRSHDAANKWDYYLLNRNDLSGGGDGLLIYHVDCSSMYRSRWTTYNKINAFSAHECMLLMRGDMSSTSTASSQRWFIPGALKITSLNDSTSPSLLSWHNESTNMGISNIRIEQNDVLFNLLEVDHGVTDLESESHAFDITLVWSSELYSSWTVTLIPSDGSGSTTFYAQRCMVNLTGMKPNTSYDIEIKGTGSPRVFRTTLSTAANNSAGVARIEGLKSTYKAGETVVLTLADLASDDAVIAWSVDGTVTSQTCLQLTAGSHKIVACATGTNGVEYFTRYITVE